MKVHLEGLGLVGSLMAARMADAGIDFTWSDAGKAICAWRASSGCCYPSSEPEDLANYRRFEVEVMGNPYLSRFCSRAAYGYASERAPHFRGRPAVAARIGPLTFLRTPSYHLNVQQFVTATRLRFARRNRAEAPDGAIRVHAHGFHGETQTRYFWGWAARARLELSDAVREAVGDAVCLNLEHLRYGSWYACPVATEPGVWWLGSSRVMQSQPHKLNVAPKLARMLSHMRAVCGSEVRLGSIESREFAHGWRPQPVADGPLAWRRGREVFLRPQASAWRHHPALWDALFLALRSF